MLSTPPRVRAQLSEALTIISTHDFPARWQVRGSCRRRWAQLILDEVPVPGGSRASSLRIQISMALSLSMVQIGVIKNAGFAGAVLSLMAACSCGMGTSGLGCGGTLRF